MTIWIIEIEAHEQRYTSEWQSHLPEQIRSAARRAGSSAAVRTISGAASSGGTTPGAFLDFTETNIFKSEQTAQIAQLFRSKEVREGDCFLFTDAWHYGIFALRYMSDLLNIPVHKVGLFHAGSYDPHDFLGRLSDRRWTFAFEKALFEAYDVSCFATAFHIRMFKQAFGIEEDARIQQVGWPMEYLTNLIQHKPASEKRDVVLFPHRLAPEKQVEIFRDLAREFPEYEFRVCQDEPLSKSEYRQLMEQSKLVFSASLQETLGIGCYEGLLSGAVPLAPDRLSYSEMYPKSFLYPSEWTESWDNYRRHKNELIARTDEALRFQQAFPSETDAAARAIGEQFFTGHKLYQILLER